MELKYVAMFLMHICRKMAHRYKFLLLNTRICDNTVGRSFNRIKRVHLYYQGLKHDFKITTCGKATEPLQRLCTIIYKYVLKTLIK
jgi:hypothetical protein